jgi:precorrin-6B methylase 2
MVKNSLIDDVKLEEWEDKGRPIIFTNQEIRKMLEMAEAGPKDIFCDLGCGWGQNLIIALTEFEVAKVIGIEKDVSRAIKCEKRLKKWEKRYPSLSGRSIILNKDFNRLLRSHGSIGSPTIVFYGLTTDQGVAESIARHLSQGARLVYHFQGLFPEILPDKAAFPFYASVYPFRKPKSEAEWLNAVIGKKISTLDRGQQPSVSELWDELRHDADVDGYRYTVSDYKRRLKKSLAQIQNVN